MTNPLPPEPHRYCELARQLIVLNPGAGELIANAINANTNFDRACDHITADALTDISFGVVQYAESRTRYAALVVANLYARRALSMYVLPEEWATARAAAALIHDTLVSEDAGSIEILAAAGVVNAANDDLHSPVRTVGTAIHAADQAGDMPAPAVTEWITNLIINRTIKAGEGP